MPHLRAIKADIRLSVGCQDQFTTRESAKKELGKAIDGYDAALSEATNTAIRERATFGLARAWEAQGDLDKATTFYKKLVEQWPDGPYTAIATDRIAALANPAVREFYDEFAKFDPSPLPTEDVTKPLEFGDRDMPKLGEGPLGSFGPGSPMGEPVGPTGKRDLGLYTLPTLDPEPADSTPADPKSVGSKEDDLKTTDPNPVDPKPADLESADPKPADPNPVDPKPTDSKPVDSQPVDPKPADSKPLGS